MPTPQERMHDLFTSRRITVDLSIGVERRIRAHLHRMNGEMIASRDKDEETETENGKISRLHESPLKN